MRMVAQMVHCTAAWDVIYSLLNDSFYSPIFLHIRQPFWFSNEETEV